jgi:hypothetical protein
VLARAAGPTILRVNVASSSELEQRRDARPRDQVDTATAAAIATVGPPNGTNFAATPRRCRRLQL